MLLPWILAARPKTLIAGLVPVLMGSAYAFHQSAYQASVFFAALFGALLIQIGTNYVNDAADFEKGADSPGRLGPPRMAASGLLSPRALYTGSALAFLAATAFGVFLIRQAGLPILFIGIASISFAVMYTAGPFPLAYLGLGDLFVLIFFGIVAVLGTVYAHAATPDGPAFALALACGTLGTSLIAINNHRDLPTDAASGKRTLAVRIGDRASRIYMASLFLLPYLAWVFVARGLFFPSGLLPALSLPLAIFNAGCALSWTERRRFNTLLGRAAFHQLLFGLLASVALVLDA